MIRVVTDSSALVPVARRDELGIKVIPIELAWPDGSVSSGDEPFTEVSGRLSSSPKPPTTAAPAPGIFQQAISQALEAADGALIVCPSSELSTTYSSAVLGARLTSHPQVRVLDSKTAAAGQGLVATAAAAAGKESSDVDAVCDRALDVAAKINIWATLQRLDYMRRSGRIPALAAVSVGALGLQPVVRYSQGSPSLAGVVRNTERGKDRLLRAFNRSKDRGNTTAVVFHSERGDDAGAISEETGADIVEITASLAAHTGGGLLGLAWFND